MVDKKASILNYAFAFEPVFDSGMKRLFVQIACFSNVAFIGDFFICIEYRWYEGLWTV